MAAPVFIPVDPLALLGAARRKEAALATAVAVERRKERAEIDAAAAQHQSIGDKRWQIRWRLEQRLNTVTQMRMAVEEVLAEEGVLEPRP